MRKAVLLLLALTCVFTTAANATFVDGVYRSEGFGVEIKLPEGRPFCGQDDPGDNGVVIYLDAKVVDCRTKQEGSSRYIALFGVVNSGEDTEIMTLDGAYKFQCHIAHGCTGAHPALTVKGRTVRTGVIKGHPSRIFVLFQQGSDRIDGVDVHNIYNITVDLQTDTAHREEDMKVMKEFLGRLQLFEPEK